MSFNNEANVPPAPLKQLKVSPILRNNRIIARLSHLHSPRQETVTSQSLSLPMPLLDAPIPKLKASPEKEAKLEIFRYTDHDWAFLSICFLLIDMVNQAKATRFCTAPSTSSNTTRAFATHFGFASTYFKMMWLIRTIFLEELLSSSVHFNVCSTFLIKREDDEIPIEFRAKLTDYRVCLSLSERYHLIAKVSKYDRGHLTPAANHKSSQHALDETFLLSNMSPQVGTIDFVQVFVDDL